MYSWTSDSKRTDLSMLRGHSLYSYGQKPFRKMLPYHKISVSVTSQNGAQPIAARRAAEHTDLAHREPANTALDLLSVPKCPLWH